MEQVRTVLRKHKQDALIGYLARAEPSVAESVLRQLAAIDLEEFFSIVKSSIETNVDLASVPLAHPVMRQAELDVDLLRKAGDAAIRRGELGFMVVAGGQGSRLGFDHPKGMFPIGVISQRSLFHIHCEKIAGFGRYFDFVPHLFVMTSSSNRAETVDFFALHNYFGLSKESVHFFEQGNLPAVDRNNQLLLSEKDALFMAPDGHGGALKALKSSGMIDLMTQSGVRYLSYFQVDNPLVNVCDPLFLGGHILRNSQLSTKVIRKRDPFEKLGNPVVIEGRSQVIEYSDLPRELALRRCANGEIEFSFGSIGIHIFNVDFISSVTTSSVRLPYHVAQKAISYFSFESASVVHPSLPNGKKFEQFVFDAIPMAKNVLFFETIREEEFAPLKNRDGDDSIETCRAGQSELFKGWLARAGYDVSAAREVEIAPSFAVCEEEFAAKARGVLAGTAPKIYLG